MTFRWRLFVLAPAALAACQNLDMHLSESIHPLAPIELEHTLAREATIDRSPDLVWTALRDHVRNTATRIWLEDKQSGVLSFARVVFPFDVVSMSLAQGTRSTRQLWHRLHALDESPIALFTDEAEVYVTIWVHATSEGQARMSVRSVIRVLQQDEDGRHDLAADSNGAIEEELIRVARG